MFSLNDRVALVTGASQGIGRATALALAGAGAKVACAARNAEKLATVVAEITAAGGEALAVQMDVAEAGQIKAGFKQLSERFARLDILVNNAACTQQAIGVMLRQRYGRIINVSSVVAETGNAGQANYVAAKAGLIGLTRAIAVEIASRSITVNAVAPGFIATPMTDGLVQPVKDAMLARIPLGRMGTDAEIASAIVFLASEQAGYITGHVLDVNGGLHMG
jgi:3-oxoacyl-[acyl-carrier protein] reductase